MTASPKRTPRNIDSFRLRKTQEKDWFWLNNELVDVFAPLVGPYAFAVYVCLARRSEGNSGITDPISQRDLERDWRSNLVPKPVATLSRTSIQRSLRVLLAAGMLVEEQPATRTEKAIYALPSLKQLAAALTPEVAEKLAVRIAQLRDRATEDDLVIVGPDSGQGAPHGTTCGPIGATLEDDAALRKNSGKTCGKDEISTESPGPHVAPWEPEVAPVGATPLITRKEEINTTPPTPTGGDECAPPHGGKPQLTLHQIRQRWHVAWRSVESHLHADTRVHSTRVRNPRPTHLTDGRDDWRRYFADLVCDGVAYGRPRPDEFTVLVRTASPAETRNAFAKYHRTWNTALAAAFNGRAPEIAILQLRQPGEDHVEN